MKALVFREANAPLELSEIEVQTTDAAHVRVTLKAAALNHRDVWITKGLYPGIVPDVVVGSDGAGMLGDRAVIINPNVDWGPDSDYPNQKTYTIRGNPTHGTMAETILLHPDRLADKPAHLSMAEAAALPLAGLTAYRALFRKARLRAGEKVLINGIGGGVALFACQFAIAAGADVYVTSSAQEKIDKAIALGAKGGALYTEERWSKAFLKQFGGVDVVIDSAAGKGYGQLMRACNPRARIVNYGGTRGTAAMDPPSLFFKELEIYGSTMGSDEEFTAMVAFVNEHKIKPVIDTVFTLDQHADAFAHMAAGKQFGKIILKI